MRVNAPELFLVATAMGVAQATVALVGARTILQLMAVRKASAKWFCVDLPVFWVFFC